MNVVLWVIASLLAVVFLGSGMSKLVQTKEKLIASRMGWAENFSSQTIKVLGVLQILGAIGLILPAVLNIAPILVPVAAIAFAIMMAGAAVVHLRRGGETQMVGFNVALVILSLIVAWGRFGPYSF